MTDLFLTATVAITTKKRTYYLMVDIPKSIDTYSPEMLEDYMPYTKEKMFLKQSFPDEDLVDILVELRDNFAVDEFGDWVTASHPLFPDKDIPEAHQYDFPPSDIHSYDQWVCVQSSDDESGELRLVEPRTGNPASVEDSNTWSKHSDAYYHHLVDDSVDWIGFVLTEDDPFCAVSLSTSQSRLVRRSACRRCV